MKKLAIALMSATLLASPAMAGKGKVVATYSGGDVTDSMIMEQFGPMLASQGDKSKNNFSDLERHVQEALIQSYINNQLFVAEAEKKGIKKTKKYKDMIAMAEQSVAQNILIDDYLKKNVTDAKVGEEYKKLANELKGQKEIKTSHILVDDEAKAKDIKNQLDKGAKFADLAKKHSTDKSSKTKGGNIGYTMRGQLVPEYETKAYSMSKGQISDPVKSQFGWHIIKLEDKRDAKVPTKEEAEPGIRQKLSKEAVDKYLKELTKDAKIEIKLDPKK